jgi:hypothetical protein
MHPKISEVFLWILSTSVKTQGDFLGHLLGGKKVPYEA